MEQNVIVTFSGTFIQFQLMDEQKKKNFRFYFKCWTSRVHTASAESNVNALFSIDVELIAVVRFGRRQRERETFIVIVYLQKQETTNDKWQNTYQKYIKSISSDLSDVPQLFRNYLNSA